MLFGTALSGLDAASTDLNVTADNIANSNTNGFKSSRGEFADVVSAVGPAAAIARGAAGDGVMVAAVTQQFTQGAIEFTERPLDLAISGQGFFRLNDGGAAVYSRDGAFGTDNEGFIVNSFGQRLTGFPADGNGNFSGALADLQISTADIAPQASSAVTLGANLDAEAAAPTVPFDPADPASYNHSTSVSIYDSLGSTHTAGMYFRKTAAGEWEHYLTIDGSQVGGADNLTFDSAGILTDPPGGTLTKGPFVVPGADDIDLTLDFSDLTQFGGSFGVNNLSQNGFTSGQIAGLSVEDNGVIFARYTNGQSIALGQVALADFTNVQGLQRTGDNAWAETFRSGPPLVGGPGTSTLGVLQSGALEGSNVDLTEQLVNLITAQRNFQANAQVISAADTLTQTILNIG
jgi:flagellar hook protein FlgE